MTMGVGTASWLEIAWTLVALAGFIHVLYMAYYWHQTLAYIRAERLNGARVVSARGHRRAKLIFAWIMFVFIVIGITAMLAPSPAGDNRPTITGIALTIGFISISIAINVEVIFRRRDYAHIVEIEERRRNA